MGYGVPQRRFARFSPEKAVRSNRVPFTRTSKNLHTSSQRNEALFTVAIAIGLRLGEILGLKWEDIDFEKETLSVRRQFRRVLGTAAFCEPKTQRAKRTIPLPKFAREALKEHRLIQEFQIKPLAGNRWKEHGLVFTSGIGTPLEERNMRRSLEEILSKHNLPKLRFHDLRHSCASLLLALGLNPRIIMEILGHSQITLTLNTYAHVAQELQTEAAEKMNALFTSTGTS
jgi:integrase